MVSRNVYDVARKLFRTSPFSAVSTVVAVSAFLAACSSSDDVGDSSAGGAPTGFAGAAPAGESGASGSVSGGSAPIDAAGSSAMNGGATGGISSGGAAPSPSAGAAGASPTSSGGTGGTSSVGTGGAGAMGDGMGGRGGMGGGTSRGGLGGTGGSMLAPLPTSFVPVRGYQSTKTNIAHGKIEITTYDNSVLGKIGNNGRKASVYLPPGYDATKKYPVLYALHGIGGDQREWVATDSYPQQVLDNLYAANKIVPMIVVFPNGRAMNPDSPPADLYGTANVNAFNVFWDKDFKNFLIPHIEKTYPVYKDKEHRAVLGYSMGGMQALNFGLGNPDYFTYVGALAPATAGLGHPDVNKFDAAAMNANFHRIFISAGTADTLYEPARTFHDKLTAKGITNIWVSVEGGKHSGTTWSPGLYNFSQIIFH